MVDLTNIKLAVFDFDDTLCIHPKHGYTDKDELELELRVYKDETSPWSKHSKSRHMQEFINSCIEKKIHMGMMSLAPSFKHSERKIHWIKENYGVDMENYSVGNREDKLRLLKVLAQTFNIEHNKIMLVDDRSDTLNEAAKNGFVAVSPMQVVNYIESRGSVNV